VRVVHAVGWYFPESSGGTEVYVDALARNLRAFGVDSSILAASADGQSAAYRWAEVPVDRYPVPAATRREIVDAVPHARFSEFADRLRAQNADVYHQHSWTRGCGLPHLAEAKRLGLKTVVTVHVPSVMCLRGTMMLNGLQACDGKVDVGRCSECWGTSRGVPRTMAAWLGRNPATAGALARLLPESRFQTALLTPGLVARRQTELAALVRNADRIVAVCRWLFEALTLNGVPERKLLYCPQGIDAPSGVRRPARPVGEHRPFRIGFLGRWDPVKGVDVLVAAFSRLPRTVSAELVIHALPGDSGYEQQVRALALADPRIRFAGPVPRDDVFSTLAGFDVLAVPSLWLETGPLVVLEAFAAGTPVLGSNLGGIAELVEPNVSGTLLPAGDVTAWGEAIAALISSPAAVRGRLIPPVPSSSRRIAEDISALYRELVGPTHVSANDASLAHQNG
jgi:glycosyltransferase involved in cell wall biosynthesis